MWIRITMGKTAGSLGFIIDYSCPEHWIMNKHLLPSYKVKDKTKEDWRNWIRIRKHEEVVNGIQETYHYSGVTRTLSISLTSGISMWSWISCFSPLLEFFFFNIWFIIPILRYSSFHFFVYFPWDYKYKNSW